MKDFFKSLFSLEEEKASIVIWMYVLTHMLGLWKAFKTGDYPDNMVVLDQFYVITIIGYSGVKLFQPKGKMPVELPPTISNLTDVKKDNESPILSTVDITKETHESGGK